MIIDVKPDGGIEFMTRAASGAETYLPADALIGLAVTSHQRDTLPTANFDVVSR